jgi:hypothetical protein
LLKLLKESVAKIGGGKGKGIMQQQKKTPEQQEMMLERF